MFCANCGHPAIETASYCTNCGHLLGPQPRPSPSLAAGGALRLPPVPWRGRHVLVGILLAVIAIFPVAIVSLGLGSLWERYEDAVVTWVSVHLMGVALLAVVWYLGLRRYGAPVSALGLKAPAIPGLKPALLTVGVLGASLAATVIYSSLVDLIGSDVLTPPEIDVDLAFPGPAVVLTFQALAIVTPLTEEVFFRGFIFAGWIARLGPWRAMVASALVFSAFHLSVGLGVIVPIFITGFLLAWLYRQTGSLWGCVAAHAGQNALVVALEVYLV